MHRSVARSSENPDSLIADQAGTAFAGETIAAISSPIGEGAIALVRISGPEALAVADSVYRGEHRPSQFTSHVQHLGEIVEAEQLIDQVMLVVHRAPASHTGEDVVEITCHGGILVTARVLEVCLRAGARAARGGEFTERAFLNGKMDLTQAEAVMDLIRAQTDLALRSATEQLEGRLGLAVKAIRDEVITLLAQLEAAIDFPDEGIAPDEGRKLRARVDSLHRKLHELYSTAEYGRILREGVRAVIYGPTNAGKSSLLNKLLGYDRAIVSDIPGTTRDTIEEVINLRGVPVRLLDTAGIRPSTDELERAGIARTERSLAAADLLLHIFDRNAPKPRDLNNERAADRIEIVLLNKSDLPEHADWKNEEALRISCINGDGLGNLEEEIFSRISNKHLRPESAVAINARHRDCLRRALDSCVRARETIEQGLSQEYVAVDLRATLSALGEILGTENDEAVLDSVFAQFCIGK